MRNAKSIVFFLLFGIVGFYVQLPLYAQETWEVIYQEFSPPLNSIWGSSPDDVYAVGDNGLIMHFDGSIWQIMDSGTQTNLNDIWGSGKNDIFAAGERLTVLYSNGNDWEILDSGHIDNATGVWGYSENHAFVCDDHHHISGFDLTGRNFYDYIAPVHFSDIWGGMWGLVAVGMDSFCMSSMSGETWGCGWLPDVPQNFEFRSVWADFGGDVAFMASSYGIFILDLTSFDSPIPIFGNEFTRFNHIFGISEGELFAVGEDGLIVRYDGIRWFTVFPENSSIWGVSLKGVWASDPGNFIVVSDQGIFHLRRKNRKADFFYDGRVNLMDAIVGLKIVAGQDVSGQLRQDYAQAEIDSDGDSMIGLGDVIYTLGVISGLR